MYAFDQSNAVLCILLALVAAGSGCLQTDTVDLNSNFDTDHQDIELNRSARTIYQESMDTVENASSYDIEADNRMVMNLPVFGVAVNMTSVGGFEAESSEINTSGTMKFSFGGNSNSTEFTNIVKTDGNVTRTASGPENERNWTEVDTYSREETGVSLESLRGVETDNVSVLGAADLEDEETLLLELDANSTDLMENSANIFEKHSPVQESADGQDMEQLGSFDEQEVYLWVDRDSMLPVKLAYYGSASQGSLQVRSVTEYTGE